MAEKAKEKPCKMCGLVFPISALSSKGFCNKCIVRRFLRYHEQSAEHYRTVLREMG